MIAEEAQLYHPFSRFDDPFSQVEHEAVPSPPPQFEYRLLYVGADLDLLTFLRDALKDEGWLVVRSPDCSTALVFLKSGIRYHLLLFDEKLPAMSGRELALRTRALEQRKDVPLILLSAKGDTVKTRRTGTCVFLQPPQPFQAVAKAIRRLHRSCGIE